MQVRRTVREGSVGLLILFGVGLSVAIILWIRGLQLGSRSYQFVIEFASGSGLEVGSPVRFRGVNVGRVVTLEPGPNGVGITVEVEPASLLIPRDVEISANQSGFIGEVSIDMTPQRTLPTGAIASGLNPFNRNCDPNLIICDGDRLRGETGISFSELISATTRLANLLGDPELLSNVSTAARSVGVAGTGVNQLTKDARQDLAVLTRDARRSLASFSTAANSVNRAANQVDQLASGSSQTVDQLGSQLGQTANRVSGAADQVTGLVQTNRGTLVATLDNLNQASVELRVALKSLRPAINQVSQGKLIQNLETLSANAVEASANLRDLTTTVNNPTNLLVLQQTLDSARLTFQNTQKITTDLDELTGDPAFRKNLRDLVNGLSQLVSSTQELEKQVQVAHQSDATPSEAARQEPPKPTKAGRFK